MSITRKDFMKGMAATAAGFVVRPTFAAGTYDPGASDTEIKIGNTCAYSGPISSSSVVGRTMAAYFQMVNDKGGVNGRKIAFISYDDAYSPPKTVEQIRRLVESDEVLLVMGLTGTPTNSATAPFLNSKNIPMLFLCSGSSKFQDPNLYPWSMGYYGAYTSEAEIYGKSILAANPNAKVGILYQNDDLGKDYLAGLKKGLGERANQLVRAEPFETTEPTVDSHILNLKSSGADTLVMATVGKFATQTIRRVADLDWHPAFYMTNTVTDVKAILEPAGLENAKGLISAAYAKDPSDPGWANDADLQEFVAFMEKYNPRDPKGGLGVNGYVIGQMMTHVLEKAGDNLTRRNIMDVATSMKDVRFKMLLPGISCSTSRADYHLIKQFRLMKFDGRVWQLFGDVISVT